MQLRLSIWSSDSLILTAYGIAQEWQNDEDGRLSLNLLLRQCCGSGIRCFFDSWILDPDRFFQDPGSQTHIFESLVTIFWVKSFIILWKLAQIFFFSISKLKKFSLMCNLWLHKRYDNNFFSPLSFVVFLDPGSGIRDPGWVKIRIRDPG